MFWQSEREAKLEKKVNKLKAENDRLKEESDSEDVRKANKISNLNSRIVNLEEVEKRLTDNIADLNAKKKREEELLKHNTKIILEKNEIEYEKKVAAVEKEKDTEIAQVKDEYRDKVEEQLTERATEMKEMYSDVLEKLTGVTGTLKQPASSAASSDK